MKAKNILLTLVAATTSVASLSANPPLITVGEHADVRALLTVTGKYQDNLYLRDNNKKSDYSVTISPGVEVNLGGADRGTANLDFVYREEFIRYSSNSSLNGSNSNLALKGNYRTSRLNVSGLASWRQLQQNTVDARLDGTLVKREVANLSVSGEYRVSDLLSAKTGVGYEQTRYKHNSFRNSENLNIPLNLYYNITPRYALSTGYRFRDTWVRSANSRQTHFFNVGIRGEMLPRLDGEILVGYNYVNYTHHKNRDGLGLDANLRYKLTPSVSLALSLSKDFVTSANGSITDKTGGSLSAIYDINPLWAASAHIGYDEHAYKDASGRKDHVTTGGVRVSYTPETYLQFSAGYNLQVNDSSIGRLGYTNNVFNLSAALRY